jgi:DNA-binding transcriptional MocR family regulator
LCDENGFSNAIRLNFSLPSPEQIEIGIERLGSVTLHALASADASHGEM